MSEQPGFKFTPGPRPVGMYWIGGVECGFAVHLMQRPRRLHRWMTRVLLGWVWEDAP
jgi:hypothetical protein